MGLPAIFGESFLDGFTMAGFWARLRGPDEAKELFAPDPALSTAGFHVTFEGEANRPESVAVDVNLRTVPEQALHTMMAMLKKEDEQRRKLRLHSEEAVHGSSR